MLRMPDLMKTLREISLIFQAVLTKFLLSEYCSYLLTVDISEISGASSLSILTLETVMFYNGGGKRGGKGNPTIQHSKQP